jgi:hypothetical protein
MSTRSAASAAQPADCALSIETFFVAMPSDSRVGVVQIRHLDRRHESLMIELLARPCGVTDRRGEGRLRRPGNPPCLIPPNNSAVLSRGVVHLTGPLERAGPYALF